MTGTVHSLQGQRLKHQPHTCCPCSPADGEVCYPHRLVELLDRLEVAQGFVSSHRFCDVGTFEELAADVRRIAGGIIDECLPGERVEVEAR